MRNRVPDRLRRIAAYAVVSVIMYISGAQGDEGWKECSPISVPVEIKLQTGGSMAGFVVDFSDDVLLVMADDKPYALAWRDLETGCAMNVRRALVDANKARGEERSAADHFDLGMFGLMIERPDLASWEFSEAIRLDLSFTDQARTATQAFAKSPLAGKSVQDIAELTVTENPTDRVSENQRGCTDVGRIEPLDSVIESLVGPATKFTSVSPLPADVRDAVRHAYLTFGETARGHLTKRLELIETDHFLIWTDWERPRHPMLAAWVEQVYRALCEQFEVPANEDIFLAKCPVFCFRAPRLYHRFARLFDGHEGRHSIGYTRSIEANGHVHVVLLRTGKTRAAFDRFASTLVHETTHAFVHRLYSTRLIPHWVNEGLAELMAERVLGERCFSGEASRILSRQIVRCGWSIEDLLSGTDQISVTDYPLAQSVVGFLEQTDHSAFRELIRRLKQGEPFANALGHSFGFPSAQVSSRWREFVASQCIGRSFGVSR